MLELWLLVALLILVAIIYKPLTRTVFGALDGHAAKVRAELDEAKRLREEAQSLLAEHQRRLAAGKDQAQAIVDQARAEVQRQTERQGVELEATLQRRTEQAMERIAGTTIPARAVDPATKSIRPRAWRISRRRSAGDR